MAKNNRVEKKSDKQNRWVSQMGKFSDQRKLGKSTPKIQNDGKRCDLAFKSECQEKPKS